MATRCANRILIDRFQGRLEVSWRGARNVSARGISCFTIELLYTRKATPFLDRGLAADRGGPMTRRPLPHIFLHNTGMSTLQGYLAHKKLATP